MPVLENHAELTRWERLLHDAAVLDNARTSFPALPTPDTQPPVKVIRAALDRLVHPDQVVELRVLGVNGKRRTDSGYFTDLDKLAKAASGYDGHAEGIYITLNPVNSALLSRANNRVKEYAGQTTGDADILKRNWLPLDFDPVRPAGISSSDAEKQAALQRAWACRTWLNAQGWPEPIFADSGNGAHLLYALDLPNDAESTDLVKHALSALSELFSDALVKLDTSTGNASRIFKLYGTLARKGDPTAERPHRRATIICAPTEPTAVSQAQLAALTSRVDLIICPAVGASGKSSLSSAAPSRHYGRAALDREIAQLRTTPAGDRNNQLFRSSAALFSLIAAGALEESEVMSTLLHSAQSIGLSDAEAHRTIQSGRERGLKNPRLLPKASTESGETEQEPLDIRQAATSAHQPINADSTGGARLVHVDALDSLPPIRWLIQDYIPEDSLVEVYGAPSAGKTQVVFDMAQTLAAAGKTVIYVVAEGLRGYRSRKKAWQQFRKQAGGELYLWTEPVQLFELSAVKEFIQIVQARKPALVVFDTLSRCSLGADENNQKDMGFILDSLDRIRRETGATVLAVHHTNAAGGRERGSTVIRGGMDVMMEVSREDELISVSCAKVKDSAEFSTLYLKPVLVDIGEEASVPVLVRAERRVQTKDDRLSALQFEILHAIGMEMFKVSGIKSSQLDEILPPGTKRASKYYNLNILIRLGYVEPHEKGDPYLITEAGRLKLSNAENVITAAMSNMSKSSPIPFIWTLPESCPMSSPIPHTYGCGMDETLDIQTEQTDSTPIPQPTASAEMSEPHADAPDEEPSAVKSNVQTESVVHNKPAVEVQPPPMTELDIARYAAQAGVRYPTESATDLCQIAEIVPRRLRAAFEAGLGTRAEWLRAEVTRRGQEPTEKPIPDLLALYLPLGFITTLQLKESYDRACQFGHRIEFLDLLDKRNTRAMGLLHEMLAGKPFKETLVIQRLPRNLKENDTESEPSVTR